MKNTIRFASLLLGVSLLSGPASGVTVYAHDSEEEVSVQAGVSKTVQFDLAEDYDEIQVKITCKDEKAAQYSYSVTSPDASKTSVQMDASGTVTNNIKDAKKGTWSVQVEDNGILGANESIGQVDVSVTRASDTSGKELSDSVEIKKELAGLKLYFKDDDLVAEWTDESVESVNVRVFDTNSQEVFANTRVTNKHIEVPVPDSTTQVTVSLTPAKAQNIEGEELQYTLNYDNHPAADITFEEAEFTNSTSLSYSAQLEQEYSIAVYDNDTLVDSLDNLQAGSYDFTVQLQEGINDITAFIVDENGNMRSTSTRVSVDTTPPTLMIENNYDGTETTSDSVTFAGKVDDYDTITFNGKEDIAVNYDGTFSVSSELTEGENKFQILAKDKSGNEAEYTAVITRIVESGGLNVKALAGLVPVAIAAIAGVIYFIIKRRGESEYVYVDENGNEVEVTDDMLESESDKYNDSESPKEGSEGKQSIAEKVLGKSRKKKEKVTNRKKKD